MTVTDPRYQTRAKKFRTPPETESLAAMCPEVAKDWDHKKNAYGPSEVRPGSHDKAHFVCHIDGYRWGPVCIRDQVDKEEAKRQTRCVRCGSVATRFPAQAKLWHPTRNPDRPEDVRFGINDGRWWFCEKHDYEYPEKVNSRCRGDCPNAGGPCCKGENISKAKLASPKHKTIAGFPQLARELDPSLTPRLVAAWGKTNVLWQCLAGKGHPLYPALPCNRTRKKKPSGCPKCGHEGLSKLFSKPTPGQSLAEQRPDVVAKCWDYAKNKGTPFSISWKSSKEVWCKCADCGTEWLAKPSKLSIDEQCCRKCKSFAILFSWLMPFWDADRNSDLNPYDITPGSGKTAHFICQYGHRFPAQLCIVTRPIEPSWCPRCVQRASKPQIRIATELCGLAFPDLIQDHYFGMRGKRKPVDVDLFIPSLHCVIEYDGKYHHRSPETYLRDLDKTAWLVDHSNFVIRIRHIEHLPIDVDGCAVILYDGEGESEEEIKGAVLQVLAILQKRIPANYKKLKGLRFVEEADLSWQNRVGRPHPTHKHQGYSRR